MSSEEIQQEINKKEKEAAELKKQKEQALIDEGKAYRCKCGFLATDEKTSEWTKKKQCYSCYRREKQEMMRKDVFDKLQYGRVTNIDLIKGGHQNGAIQGLTIHKNGMAYEIEIFCEEDELYGFGEITNYEKCEEPLIEDEIKPWKKERQETKLI